MKELRSFQEVHSVLKAYIPISSSPMRAYSLDRIRELMTYLGNPQDAYKAIHVAGTSGKTSTCYYVADMLGSAGQKVGLSVSPHVDEVNERAQINLKPLPERKFCTQFSKFLNIVEQSGIKPTYFELLMAFAFWEFAEEKVDYAVIEVGLGGLLDGSNVMARQDKICVITDIGLDHIEVLGNTLTAIATQKAGIIHPGNHVFSYSQGREVDDVLNKASQEQRAILHVVKPAGKADLAYELPLFQQRNWYLASKAYEFVAQRDALSPIKIVAKNVHIPARMETVKYKDKIVIMDGAHNSQKLEALVASLRHEYGSQPIAVLAGFVHTKQSRLRENLEVIAPIADHVIATAFSTPDTPRSSVDTKAMTEILNNIDQVSWESTEDPKSGFQKLINRPEKILLITGSFFLLNHIRPIVFQKA